MKISFQELKNPNETTKERITEIRKDKEGSFPQFHFISIASPTNPYKTGGREIISAWGKDNQQRCPADVASSKPQGINPSTRFTLMAYYT